MDKLITDSARVEISNESAKFYVPYASTTGRTITNIKTLQNIVGKSSKEHTMVHERQHPANIWLLTGEWIADVMNHTAEKSLQWRPPLEVLTGQTVDISILLCFLFWDVVYVTRYDDTQYKGQVGSNKSSEIRGRFVGFSHHVGHALTFKILTDDTRHIIHRSRVRLAKDGRTTSNLKQKLKRPDQSFHQVKTDSEGDDVILPTIDLTSIQRSR
jgi:hypothetical protein